MSTWLFTNIEPAECPYTECKMWLDDCVTPYPRFFVQWPKLKTSAPWKYVSTDWHLKGWEEKLCVECKNRYDIKIKTNDLTIRQIEGPEPCLDTLSRRREDRGKKIYDIHQIREGELLFQ